MPAKVKISTVTVTEREIEIPDKCPECKADLTKVDSVRESGYVAFSSCSYIDHGEVCSDANDTDFADSMRTRYECIECSHVLAEG